jgi:hypothetical protein
VSENAFTGIVLHWRLQLAGGNSDPHNSNVNVVSEAARTFVPYVYDVFHLHQQLANSELMSILHPLPRCLPMDGFYVCHASNSNNNNITNSSNSSNAVPGSMQLLSPARFKAGKHAASSPLAANPLSPPRMRSRGGGGVTPTFQFPQQVSAAHASQPAAAQPADAFTQLPVPKFTWPVDLFERAMSELLQERIVDCVCAGGNDLWLAVGTDVGSPSSSEFVCPVTLIVTTHRLLFVCAHAAPETMMSASADGECVSVDSSILQVSFHQILSLHTHNNWKEAGNVALEVGTTLDAISIAFVFRHRTAKTRPAGVGVGVGVGVASPGIGGVAGRRRRCPLRLFNHMKEEILYRKGADEFDVCTNSFEGCMCVRRSHDNNESYDMHAHSSHTHMHARGLRDTSGDSFEDVDLTSSVVEDEEGDNDSDSEGEDESVGSRLQPFDIRAEFMR